jgi:hypothetical protein
VTDAQLLLAQQSREDALLMEDIDRRIDLLFSEADTVGPDARHKLRGILRHYAKMPHPFRACVKDNMKRFGPGRTERVCATLKDIIRGTTKWRGHPAADHGSAGLSLDEEVEKLLLSIPDEKLESFFSAVSR